MSRLVFLSIAAACILTTGAMGVFAQDAPAPTLDVMKALTYEVIITDGQDFADFWDIREVAYAEPGGGFLVVRFSVTAWTATQGGSIDHFFTPAKNAQKRWSLLNSGSATGGHWDKCIRDGTKAYCYVTYERLGVKVGDKITGTSAISYAGVAQDYAPGGLFIPDGVLSPKGKDYTITGGPAVAAPALPELFNLTANETDVSASGGEEAQFELTIQNDGNESANYTVNVTGLPATFDASFDAANGTIDGQSSASATLTVSVPEDATEGSYTFNVTVAGPMGGNATLNLTLAVLSPIPSNATTVAGTGTSGTAAGSPKAQDEEGGIPAPGAAFVLAALAATGILLRRRR